MADIFDMTDTWNDSGTTFSAIKMDVTDTASAAGSKLLDLQIGSAPYFEMTKGRAFNIYNTHTDASNYERGFMRWNSNVLEIGAEAAGTGIVRPVHIRGGSGSQIYISSNLTYIQGGGVDIRMFGGNIFPQGISAGLGSAASGWKHLYLAEQGTAPAAASNLGVIYTEDNGAGKTRLMVRFGTGAAQQIAIEP